MNQRSPDELRQELQGLDQAHAQNEAGRDNFVALSHTALFAASVSFVGSAVPLKTAIWLPALVAGWTIDVLGLLALTISFATARRAIDERRSALYAEIPPIAVWSDRLNGFALWSFPAALLCLFSFVTANVVNINDRQTKSTATATIPFKRVQGNSPPAAGTPPAGGRVTTADGRCTGSTRPSRAATPASSTATSEKVTSRCATWHTPPPSAARVSGSAEP